MSAYGVNTELKYFAAANGYKGFTSYFNTVFNPREYEKIFILKGGPGTGKSSIMKAVANKYQKMNVYVEAIHCSSDTSSLDGVILEKCKKRIAIIDGTAPHCVDPRFPGAIEEIINLGEFWDDKILINNKEKIISITEKKSKSYNEAYGYLKLAGDITALVDKEISEYWKYDVEDTTEKILNSTNSEEGSTKTRLISSFGKNGFGRLDPLKSIEKKRYCVVGIYGSEYIFSAHLKEILDAKNINYVHFPSSLDGEKSYGFYIPSTNTTILCDSARTADDTEIVDTAKYLKLPFSEKTRCMLEFLWKEREVMLWNSADEFKKASDEHFSLEKIYTAAMNFDKLTAVTDRIYEKINMLLSIDEQ